jgi:hypothetical protein
MYQTRLTVCTPNPPCILHLDMHFVSTFKWIPNTKSYMIVYFSSVLYGKINFPYLCSNIPASPAYGVYISQLIRYARAFSTYDPFLVRGNILTDKLMSQGFQLSRLQAAFRKFYGRYNDLISPYNLSLGHMLSDMFHTNR